MKDKKSSTPFITIGSSSLLVVFLVLCLVTFATLSLTTARSDNSFSQRAADRKTAYYEASNQSEALLASLDALLWETYGKTPGQYPAAVEEKLQSFDSGDITLTADFRGDRPVISWQTPLNDDQVLAVTIALTDPADRAKEGLYEIIQWKVTSTKDWESTQTLPLMPIE